MSDYTPGRYTGFKNLVYWMATKRRNWWALAIFLAYVGVAAVSVGIALADRGTRSALPWVIGVGAYGALGLVAVVLIGLSLHWGFDLFPDRDQRPERK